MSKDGFDLFFKENENVLYRIVKGYVYSRDSAKDIVIEAMMKVYEKWERMENFENKTGYAVRIAINMAKKYLVERRLKGHFTVDLDNIEDIPFHENPEDIIMTKEEMKELETELGRLKDIERNIILLKDIERKKFDEIAQILTKKVPTIKSLYRRGKLKLSKRMEEVYETK